MPVRSLNSSIIKWPNKEQVMLAAKNWAGLQANTHPHLVQLGVFGSYATNTWGVGSDLDLIAIICDSDIDASTSFEQRGITWQTELLPVPAEIIVYTQSEFKNRLVKNDKFAKEVLKQAVWIFKKEDCNRC